MSTLRNLRRWIRRVWIGAGLGIFAWLVWNAQAHGVDDALLVSDHRVQVSIGADGMVFRPSSPTARRPP